MSTIDLLIENHNLKPPFPNTEATSRPHPTSWKSTQLSLNHHKKLSLDKTNGANNKNPSMVSKPLKDKDNKTSSKESKNTSLKN